MAPEVIDYDLSPITSSSTKIMGPRSYWPKNFSVTFSSFLWFKTGLTTRRLYDLTTVLILPKYTQIEVPSTTFNPRVSHRSEEEPILCLVPQLPRCYKWDHWRARNRSMEWGRFFMFTHPNIKTFVCRCRLTGTTLQSLIPTTVNNLVVVRIPVTHFPLFYSFGERGVVCSVRVN